MSATKENYINRLCIGTANFLKEYNGYKIDRPVADEILTLANNYEIKYIDTSINYGCFEYIADWNGPFKIYFKINSNDEWDRQGVREPYCIMKHHFDHSKLNQMDQYQCFSKIGYSVYYPEEINILEANRVRYNVLQVPYNIFDRRFENIINTSEKEIVARTVFLRGAIYNRKNQKLDPYLNELNILARKINIPVYALCLCFVLSNSNINRVVVGVDSSMQLKQLILSMQYMNKVKEARKEIDKLIIQDKDIVDPLGW